MTAARQIMKHSPRVPLGRSVQIAASGMLGTAIDVEADTETFLRGFDTHG